MDKIQAMFQFRGFSFRIRFKLWWLKNIFCKVNLAAKIAEILLMLCWKTINIYQKIILISFWSDIQYGHHWKLSIDHIFITVTIFVASKRKCAHHNLTKMFVVFIIFTIYFNIKQLFYNKRLPDLTPIQDVVMINHYDV